MSRIRNDIAQHIRMVDGGNDLGGYQLGEEIAVFLRSRGLVDEATENAVADFVGDANSGVGYRHPKRLGGVALADAIVDHFKLDQEN